MAEEKIKVLIVDDQTMFAESLTALLQLSHEVEVLGCCFSGEMAIEFVKNKQPDVILMDYSMPGGMNGAEATESIVRDFPEMRILILTFYDTLEYVKEALAQGAKGYLLKNTGKDGLIYAIKMVMAGKYYIDSEVGHKALIGEKPSAAPTTSNLLTKREADVLRLVADGKTSQQVASELFVSKETVETHRKNLLSKTGCKNVAELIRWAVREGLV
jgi:DNA-binding NarL/FixJ family response regulator